MTEKKTTNFKPVAVHKDDWERYSRLANDLSGAISIAVNDYVVSKKYI